MATKIRFAKYLLGLVVISSFFSLSPGRGTQVDSQSRELRSNELTLEVKGELRVMARSNCSLCP